MFSVDVRVLRVHATIRVSHAFTNIMVHMYSHRKCVYERSTWEFTLVSLIANGDRKEDMARVINALLFVRNI